MLAFSAIADTPLADDTEVRFIGVPAANVSVAGIAPDLVGNTLRVFPPAANVVVSVVAPTAVTGALVKVENAQVTLIKRVPRYVGPNVIVRPSLLGDFGISANRPTILSGVFTERRIKFVILRQTGG
jgi:hypothetical protein